MSLTDLKRKKPKQVIKVVSVEDFIEDANNYASGKARILAIPPVEPKGLDKKSAKLYRHATFTLTETSIAQLDLLAKETKVAKSRLLRILIDEFSQRKVEEQLEVVNKSKQADR